VLLGFEPRRETDTRVAFDQLSDEIDYLTRKKKWLQTSKEIEIDLDGKSNTSIGD